MSIADHAAAAAALLGHLGVRRAHVAGHSSRAGGVSSKRGPAFEATPPARTRRRVAAFISAVKALRSVTGDSSWLFPSPKKEGASIAHAQKAIERVVERSGVAFRGHDLRRTAASLMVGAGVPRLVVSKILNHVETGVTAVYDRHSYDLEKRAALDFWGKRLEAIVANKRPAAKLLRFSAAS